jgi:hypothetical protein
MEKESYTLFCSSPCEHFLAAQRQPFCVELTFHTPPQTPPLLALTLSAGENQVIGDELKVSRQAGPASHFTAPRPDAQTSLPRLSNWAPLYFDGHLETPLAPVELGL